MSISATGSNDSATSRFEKEGYQEPYIALSKSLTSKPVVGVGRYTSPEAMVSAIQRGVMDLIGAARPSIADPFLPEKIKEGRVEDIRECIGCNICVTGDTQFVPIRCTQNPTMGEEWRRGWHPEIIPAESKRCRGAWWSAPDRPVWNVPVPWVSAAIEVSLLEARPRAGRAGAPGSRTAGSE